MLKPGHLFARNAAHLVIVAYFYLAAFLPVGLEAEVYAGVEGGADLVGNAVGEAVEGVG